MRATSNVSCAVRKSHLSGLTSGILIVITMRVDEYGYKEDDIVLLTDDARNPRQIPTRENLVRFELGQRRT